jgi:UDP-N-acetylglucosamine 4,6-dehydratase/5-epimerase
VPFFYIVSAASLYLTTPIMNWTESTVLITGGTGSFGKKFTELALSELRPKKLIIFSRDELKQHEMRQIYPEAANPAIRFFVGDVRDQSRLERAFHGVDVVVHAAALKQVPTCEYNPFEAIQTNIIGAKNIIDAAINQRVKKVIALSTDKAVNPVNLYGATKLCAEKLFVQGNAYAGGSGTRFSCVRYGNVVGSRGSVIPLFQEQRKAGCLTVTDARMTRFWITLEQSVRLVFRAAEQMSGGELFIPKIPSMNMMDLATAIGPDCKIEQTGIRPGEKLHEVLLSEDEARNAVELDDIYIVYSPHPSWPQVKAAGSRTLPEGFHYSSDQNPHHLDVGALRKLILQQCP